MPRKSGTRNTASSGVSSTFPTAAGNSTREATSVPKILYPELSSALARVDTALPTQMPPELFSLQSLLGQSTDESEWVIPELLPTGVSLLAGPPQADKTLLASQLGLSVAAGLPFLKRFPAYQGHVLYLALAEDARRIRGRVMRLIYEQVCPNSFTLAFKWSPLRTSGLADLEDTLLALGDVRLVVIDPFMRLLPQPPTPNYRGRQASPTLAEPGFFLPLRELTTRFHLALLLLHHLPNDNHLDPLVGPSPTGLTPVSASNLLFTPGTCTSCATLHVASAKVEEKKLALTLDEQTRQWHYRSSWLLP